MLRAFTTASRVGSPRIDSSARRMIRPTMYPSSATSRDLSDSLPIAALNSLTIERSASCGGTTRPTMTPSASLPRSAASWLAPAKDTLSIRAPIPLSFASRTNFALGGAVPTMMIAFGARGVANSSATASSTASVFRS